MNVSKSQHDAEYVVPARRLSGTREEIVKEIDELIVGLAGLRELVLLHGPAPAALPKPKLRLVKRFVATMIFLATLAVPAAAQAQAAAEDPNPGSFTLTASFDVVSKYMFRGIRQHASGVALWPVADLGVAVYSGDGGLTSAGVNVGSWNSLHTGDTGAKGPTGKIWYESDFYTTLTLGFGGGTSLATTYTAYTSPNNAFTTVKEIAFKVSVDDTGYLGKAAVKPYALLAFEFDTEPGVGQADGGLEAGRYLELGAAPGYAGTRASLAVPVKVGLSLGDYYELSTGSGFVDHTFGYFSVAGLVTVPVGGMTRFGAWNVHGAVEYQALGETAKFFHGGDASRVIGSVGIGFTY